jgi:hypothetical protein
VHEALERLVEHGYLRLRPPPPRGRGGRPPGKVYDVHPQLGGAAGQTEAAPSL